MITNDKQYEAAKQQSAQLAESLAAPTKTGVPRINADAGREQMEELMAEIQHNIDEYEARKNRRPEI